MASAPPTTTVSSEEDEFEKSFNEFAATRNGTPPTPPEEQPNEPPQGNAPPEEPSAEPAPEAPKDETGTSGSAEAGDPPPPVDTAPDWRASLPEDIRAQVIAREQELERERDQALQRARSSDGRVSALSRKLSTLTASAPPAPAEKNEALEAKIKQAQEDFPDAVGPLVELIESQRERMARMEAQLGNVSEQRQAEVVEQQLQALAAEHPDFREVAQSPQFTAWLEGQPEGIQGLAGSLDAREVSTALSLYKQATGSRPPSETEQAAATATDAKRKQQLEGGRVAPSRPAPAASGPPEDFDAAFEYHRKRREAARQAHRR